MDIEQNNDWTNHHKNPAKFHLVQIDAEGKRVVSDRPLFIVENENDLKSDTVSSVVTEVYENLENFYFECNCKSYNRVQGSSRKKKDGRGFTHHPNQRSNHDPHCCLSNEPIEKHEIVEDLSNVSGSILLPNRSTSVEQPNNPHVSHQNLGYSVQTFGGTMSTMLSEAYTQCFNTLNKNISRFNPASLKNVNMTSLLNCFESKLNALQIDGMPKIDFERKTGCSFVYGIKGLSIKNFSDSEKDVFTIRLNGSVYTINKKLLEEAFNYINLHGDIQIGPYFFFAVVQQNKIVRLFLALAACSNGFVAIVDSDRERRHIVNFFKAGKVLYKPIKTKDIVRVLTKERGLAKEFYKKNENKYCPDIFIFHEDVVEIIEVNGELGEKYDQHLHEKEDRCYFLLDAKLFYYRQVKEIDTENIT